MSSVRDHLIRRIVEELSRLSLDELRMVSGQVRDLPGEPLGLEQVAASGLTYRNRGRRRETVVEFLKRAYGPWLGTLTRDQLIRLDRSCYDALYQYEHRHGRLKEARDGFELATRHERIDAEIAALDGALPGPSADEKLRRRLRENVYRRRRRSDK